MAPDAPSRFAIWGSAGHARVLADLLARLDACVIALFDNDPAAAPAIPGVPLAHGIAGFSAWCAATADRDRCGGLVAIGGARGRDRLAIQDLFRRHGLQLPAVIHPRASRAHDTELGAGTQLLAGAIVGPGTTLGDACIINHGAIVDHECTLGHGVHVAPGAVVTGCVTIGDHVMIGAGATVLPRLCIGADSIVGAGAVVTRDVPPGTVVRGNPARVAG